MTDTISHIIGVIDALSSLSIVDKSEQTTQTIYNKMTEMKSDCDNNKCKAWVWCRNGIIPHCCNNNSIVGGE